MAKYKTLNSAMNALKKVVNKDVISTVEKAEIFGEIRDEKLYLKKAESFAKLFEVEGGEICGVKYSQGRKLADANKYVYVHEELREYGWHLAVLLITPCKKDYAKIHALIKKDKISPTMNSEELRELLVSEGMRKGDVVKSNTSELNEAIMLLDAYIATLAKKDTNKSMEKMGILDAWDTCKKALEK